MSSALGILIRFFYIPITTMENKQNTGLDYANGKVSSLFSKLFFPTLLGLIFNALITIVDGIFVGQGVGADGIAAVNIIAPLYMVVTGTGLMFGIGSSVVAGISIAQSSNRKAAICVTQACVFCSALMLILLSIFVTFPVAIAKMLGCSDDLMPHALDYFIWLIPGMFFLCFECIGMMVIRLDGSPKYAMFCNIIPAVTNIVLDYLFIFPLGMGVKGAAIATSASIAIGGIMVLIYFLKFSYVIKFVWSAKEFFTNIWRQARIGSSAFITEIAMSIMMLTGNYMFTCWLN